MQSQMFEPEYLDLSDKKVLIGISGGINSAALLCFLATEYPIELKPKMVYLFAIQLKEHSPDTFDFMKDCIRYAACNFSKIKWKIKWGSVLNFFKQEKMIPHPILSPCSDKLKIEPMRQYMLEHNIDIDLIGYVRTERNRINRQLKLANNKYHPIAHLSNNDCFCIVKREIGWYPAIYDIRNLSNNKRVFSHNNCLPCKNESGILLSNGKVTGGYKKIKVHYPEYYNNALKLSQEINSYWGRKEKEPDDSGFCRICEFL